MSGDVFTDEQYQSLFQYILNTLVTQNFWNAVDETRSGASITIKPSHEYEEGFGHRFYIQVEELNEKKVKTNLAPRDKDEVGQHMHQSAGVNSLKGQLWGTIIEKLNTLLPDCFEPVENITNEKHNLLQMRISIKDENLPALMEERQFTAMLKDLVKSLNEANKVESKQGSRASNQQYTPAAMLEGLRAAVLPEPQLSL